MTDQTPESPLAEQEICITCGMCCDGTLFLTATLDPGEKGKLPPLMEERYFKKGEEEYFHLPCPYFDCKCTIYDQKKAHVCSGFRCRLLKDFSKKRISQQTALNIVKNAMTLREQIINAYYELAGREKKVNYRTAQREIYKRVVKQETELTETDKKWKLLSIRCNILETLLIRHFKPKDEFNKMIAEPEAGF